MNKEIIVSKESITIPCPDTVTIPREEYNDLIAAKTLNSVLLAVSDSSGYGCSEIVKGLQKMDKYRSALIDTRNQMEAMQKEYLDKIACLEAKLHDAEAETEPEESAYA